jgi:hypothetical protein
MLEYDYTEPQKIIPEVTNPMRPVEYGLNMEGKQLVIRQTVKTVGMDIGGHPVDTILLVMTQADVDYFEARIKVILARDQKFKNLTVKAVMEG